MWYMIMIYDNYMWSMIVDFLANVMWYIYTWWFGQRC